MNPTLNPLPPVFDALLASIAGMHQTMKAATLYFPTVGRRRAYQSESDALSYAAGWSAFDPGAVGPHLRTPFADGWHDAAAAHEDSEWAALERHHEDGDHDRA